MSNPFVDRFDALGWLAAGDHWAKVALAAADRARECWANARASADRSEAGFKDLALAAHDERDAERALWAAEVPDHG